MITVSNKADCTGCYGCMNICPKQCIDMAEDAQGFRYPVPDMNTCIKCGQCIKICHMKQSDLTSVPQTAFAAKNKDLEIRLNSSSGGVFAAVAGWIIEQNGAVYGAAFNPSFEVGHIRITKVSEIQKLQTSKYVQSLIGDTYSQAKKDLQDGKYVLFTGTPCQIAGLRGYLGRDYETLFCQDILCHGVPSPKLWRNYLSELDAPVKSVRFRDKSSGWSRFHVVIDTGRSRLYDVFNKNTYMRAFLADASLRPSCYECHYKNLHFAGDYIIGDFWGVDAHCPEMDDDNGVSLFFVNTEKGTAILDAIREHLDYKEVAIPDAIAHNGAAVEGASMNAKHTALFANIDNMTVHQLVEKYIRGSLLRRVLNKLKR